MEYINTKFQPAQKVFRKTSKYPRNNSQRGE